MEIPCPVCSDVVAVKFRGSDWCVECVADTLADQQRESDSRVVGRELFTGRLSDVG